MPSVVMALDRALRAFGGAPTYALTDNERTVSIDQCAGSRSATRRSSRSARHYGLTIATCVPADPQSKGGSEATVRIAKADLVPTEHNLRGGLRGLRASSSGACAAFCERVNTREHRVTRRAPAVMLAEERARLHPLPAVPHTVCFGETRKVSWQSTIVVGGALYSVPSRSSTSASGRAPTATSSSIVHVDAPDGPREVARHELTTPGRPSIRDEHYPPRPPGALERRPKARTTEERAFLAIGPGAGEWLTRAAAAGAVRVRRKMAEAVELAKLHGAGARR